MGTLPRELGQCAADAEVTCVGAATHVPLAGLDVHVRVDQAATGAPGLGAQQLLTAGLLVRENETGSRVVWRGRSWDKIPKCSTK